MTDVQILFECGKLLVAIVGGICVASYWNRQKHKLEEYRYLDASYQALLEAYLENSQFADARRTHDYATAFPGDEGFRYHCFAMRVHTTMETIYDVFQGKIHPEWIQIFRYHAGLHFPWLLAFQDLHEPSYVACVRREIGHGDLPTAALPDASP